MSKGYAVQRHSDSLGRFVLWQGDCRNVFSLWDDNSVDAIVTDPPYELGFMGKSWDASGVAYDVDLWREALRVLKPGGHLLAFGGSRTYHRLACAVEDAGFEIRDQIMWVYGSGFPKSLNVKKSAGNHPDIHESLGTALKPAHEPIVVARKPLEGTVAANVLKWGTGALNIDGCRIGFQSEADERTSKDKNRHADFGTKPGGNNVYGDYSMIQRTNYDPSGRWPANFIHDGSDEVLALFPDTGKSTGGRIGKKSMGAVTNVPAGQYEAGDPGYGDSGSAARFFYCAKASKAERNAGLGHLEPKREHDGRQDGLPGGDNPRNRTNNATQNHHPTVKPIALMRYLIRLVTPPGGVVLDPFAGSGTTMVAALMEGAQPWGCEMTADYVPIILGRIQWALDKKPTDTLFSA